MLGVVAVGLLLGTLDGDDGGGWDVGLACRYRVMVAANVRHGLVPPSNIREAVDR